MIYFTMQNAFNTNSSIYISDMRIGGADTASTATMCNTLGGILGGICFGVLVSKTKQQIETVALAMSGAGFLLCFFLPSLIPILIGGAMVGFGFAVFNAAGTYLLSKSLRPENNAFTASIYMAAINLGAAISPMVVNPISSIFEGTTATRFLMTGIAIVICAIISLITNIIHSVSGN
ncbi:MAG: MFS transporter [Oscillospiraceae bacterium]|nr:MFS transporter [Oscillospiraceae bacterium]